jgi:phospholipase C
MSTDRIAHVVVLMLENRSFDHLLGFSGIPGIEPPPPTPLYTEERGTPEFQDDDMHRAAPSDKPGAAYIGDLFVDPDHSFEAVHTQLTLNGPNQGFLYSYAHQVGTHLPSALKIMQCVPQGRLPSLEQLAREFTLCTHWFASVPGPTIPNRMFAHLGTANGNVRMELTPYTVGGYGGNSIYGLLRKAATSTPVEPYRIYCVGGSSLSMVIPDVLTNLDGSIAWFDDFFQDVNGRNGKDTLPQYSFIEPNYSDYFNADTYRQVFASDQHPDHDLRPGDHLIADVYNAIRNSPRWEDTVLLITYDEHGGLFDHVPPGPTVAPDGIPAAIGDDDHPDLYHFETLGVRVPAIVVSKYSPRAIDTTVYDHTSIPKTALDLFAQGSRLDLGARAAAASSFLTLTDTSMPRDDTPRRLRRARFKWSSVRATRDTRAKSKLLTEHQAALVQSSAIAEEMMHGTPSVDPASVRTEHSAAGYLRRVAKRLPMRGVAAKTK